MLRKWMWSDLVGRLRWEGVKTHQATAMEDNWAQRGSIYYIYTILRHFLNCSGQIVRSNLVSGFFLGSPQDTPVASVGETGELSRMDRAIFGARMIILLSYNSKGIDCHTCKPLRRDGRVWPRFLIFREERGEAIEAILTCRLGYLNSSWLRLVEAGSDARVPREGVNRIARSGKK